jgi:hypothetical protein
MIRRTAAGLGMLAVVSITALAVPMAASAAEGKLYINKQVYQDPSGCINFQAPDAFIYNQTDAPVVVFTLPNCQGHVTTVIGSSDYRDQVTGKSLELDQAS